MLAFVAFAVALQSPVSGAMKFEGLGPHHRHIKTRSREAEIFFNQGLEFMYGFNHDEAIQAFREVARLDPQCPMAYWGIATANGPNINNPAVDADHAKAAWEALQKAKALSANGSPVEQALIRATAARFVEKQPPDRSALDLAYANEMRNVWHAYPRDSDVGALFAESMLDLRPWNQWKKDGTPQPGTEEILATCRAVLRLEPNHPQALHITIHATEGSSHPERAIDAANRLRFLQPGLGHMVHMPSHIDVRTGQWQRAIDANERALAVDYAYRKRRGKLDFYRFYIAHNHEMLGYAAMMIGQSQKSIRAMDTMLAGFKPQQLKELAPLVDGMVAMPLEARVRFGKWDEILAAPDYPDYFPVARMVRHYARGIAFAAKGQLAEAHHEQDLFEFAAAAVPGDAMVGFNPAATIADLCRHMLQGELAVGDNKLDSAASELSLAVKAEDSLAYDEPPDWVMPVRHALGAILIKAGKFNEAARVYREDLKKLPSNGWSLFGLAEAQTGEGRAAEARRTKSAFALAWKGADMPISTSCMCVKK